MTRRLAAALVMAILAAACSGKAEKASPTLSPPVTSANPSPAISPPSPSPSLSPLPLSKVRIHLVRVATLEQPLAMAIRAGDDALYIAGKTGRVMAVRGGRVDPKPVLDLRGQVSLGSEQGLLGLAFSPDARFLYVNYTDVDGDTRVVEFAMRNGRADPSTRRQVLFVDQPFSNHNGGDLVFGPDGHLYIGLGDGGSGGDPFDNAQNLGALLGKMLRIDPRPEAGRPYGIPSDNPFLGRQGARSEVWAYGLRNPWRYSFDRETHDLWIGDVGQSSREEIDFRRAGSRGGENYGWNRLEGDLPFNGAAPPGTVRPIFEYETGEGGTCAVVGGYVYRGTAIPGLRGAYLFGDFCAGFIKAFRREGGKAVQLRTFGHLGGLSSFGEDREGELYVMSLLGGLYRIVP